MERYWLEFITIASVHMLAVASPGPDFTITIRQSLKYGSKTGIYTAIGIGSGIFLHVLYSLLGLGLLIAKFDILNLAMRIIAAAYLVYLGVLSLRAKPQKADSLKVEHEKPPGFVQAFKVGFITNALNPKATLFFLSLYVSIVDATTPYHIQGFYGLYMAIATTVWFSFVAKLFGNQVIRHRFEKRMHIIEWVVGVLLIALAIKLLLSN